MNFLRDCMNENRADREAKERLAKMENERLNLMLQLGQSNLDIHALSTNLTAVFNAVVNSTMPTTPNQTNTQGESEEESKNTC